MQGIGRHQCNPQVGLCFDLRFYYESCGFKGSARGTKPVRQLSACWRGKHCSHLQGPCSLFGDQLLKSDLKAGCSLGTNVTAPCFACSKELN